MSIEFRIGLILFCLACTFLRAQTPVVLDPLVATASRSPAAPSQQPFSFLQFSGEDLRLAPATTLDGALRASPGFSLFRRSDSLTANPTAQGVSLRGLGPSGASRSLVLLDGVPLNDPFGGWIAWSKVPRAFLRHVDLSPGGGATAWGHAALAGIIQIESRAPAGRAGEAVATIGDFDTRSIEAAVDLPAGGGELQVLGRVFQSSGFVTVAGERRGSIDTAAGGRHRWLNARWRRNLSEGLQMEVSARVFSEKRTNGTPYQRNRSQEIFGSVSLFGQPGATFSWTARAYVQDQSFSSTFSSVNATRTAETPASDQYDVPASARGAAWTGAWAHQGDAITSAGIDWRGVRGETRELFSFAGGTFTRRRLAGGSQTVGGVFVQHERPLGGNVRGTLGARMDGWRESAGHRTEADAATAALFRDDRFPARDGIEFSPSVGIVWQAAPVFKWRAAAQQAFRRPTLNELHRPFRVGNVITEANAGLRTETVNSAETGVEFSSGAMVFSAVAFRNDLRDAVANVTLARGPATVPGFGFVPAGGAARQRLNLERVRVQGVEVTAKWTATAELAVTAAYLYNDTAVLRATVSPALTGRELAQVPRHTATLGARWRAAKNWTLEPRVRWIGGQFEDDENVLPLGSAIVGDVSVRWRVGERMDLFVAVENVGDARIETGRSADGVFNVGQPRFTTGGLRLGW